MSSATRILVLTLIGSLMLAGCAKTVTQIVTYGEQMTVTVTLRGDLNADANRYFLVLGNGSDLNVPLPPPDNISDEMIEPGDSPVAGTVADYYTNYYDTWAGYIVVDPGGYYLVKGPFMQGESITRESIANLGAASNKLVFDFNLSKIYGSAVPARIYFDFVSVEWPAGEAKLASDHLSLTNPYIDKFSGSLLSIDNDVNTGLDPSVDIIRCDIEIQ